MDNNIHKKDAEKAFQDATKEVKDKQVANLKDLIKRTLEAKARHTKIRDEANRQISILKLDLEDLKAGRLDRIEERQKKDPHALKTSVAKIEKVKEVIKEVHHHHDYDRWWHPYRIVWQDPTPYWKAPFIGDPIYGEITDNTGGFSTLAANTDSVSVTEFTLNNSLCADFGKGAYELQNGTVKHI